MTRFCLKRKNNTRSSRIGKKFYRSIIQVFFNKKNLVLKKTSCHYTHHPFKSIRWRGSKKSHLLTIITCNPLLTTLRVPVFSRHKKIKKNISNQATALSVILSTFFGWYFYIYNSLMVMDKPLQSKKSRGKFHIY